MTDKNKIILVVCLLVIATVVVGLFWNRPKPTEQNLAQPNLSLYSSAVKIKEIRSGQLVVDFATAKINEAGLAQPEYVQKYISLDPETEFFIIRNSALSPARLSDLKPGQSIVVYSNQSIAEHQTVKALKIDIQ